MDHTENLTVVARDRDEAHIGHCRRHALVGILGFPGMDGRVGHCGVEERQGTGGADGVRLRRLDRVQEDLGPAEIAELLKMPVNTVKSTLNRSLAELRKKLARSFGEMKYAIF